MPIKIHIDEAFILKVEVSKKNPNFYLLPIHLKTEYYVVIDTIGRAYKLYVRTHLCEQMLKLIDQLETELRTYTDN